MDVSLFKLFCLGLQECLSWWFFFVMASCTQNQCMKSLNNIVCPAALPMDMTSAAVAGASGDGDKPPTTPAPHMSEDLSDLAQDTTHNSISPHLSKVAHACHGMA